MNIHGFEVKETASALGGTRRQAYDTNGERYELRALFEAYMRFEGMPGIADVGLEQDKALSLEPGLERSFEGIRSVALVEWHLPKSTCFP